MNLKTFYAASVILAAFAIGAQVTGQVFHARQTRAAALHLARPAGGAQPPAPYVDHHATVARIAVSVGMALAVSALVCMVLSSLKSERTWSTVLPLSFLIAYLFLFLLHV